MSSTNNNNNPLTIVDKINIVLQLRRQSVSEQRDIREIVNRAGFTIGQYNGWIGIIKEVRKPRNKYTKNANIISAAKKVLREEFVRYNLMRYCPLNKHNLYQCIGYKKKTLRKYGQLVRVLPTSNNSRYVEIVDNWSTDYCGAVNRGDLLAADIDKDELKARHVIFKESKAKVPNKEIEEKAAIIKEKNKLKREATEQLAARQKAEKRQKRENLKELRAKLVGNDEGLDEFLN